MTTDQYNIYREAYKDIIEEQTIISYTIKGITFEDTNNMSRYDRKAVFKSLEHIREVEKEAQENALKEAESKRKSYNFR